MSFQVAACGWLLGLILIATWTNCQAREDVSSSLTQPDFATLNQAGKEVLSNYKLVFWAQSYKAIQYHNSGMNPSTPFLRHIQSGH